MVGGHPGSLGDAFKGLKGGVVAGDPDGLDFSGRQYLRCLEYFARVGDRNFFEFDAVLLKQLAADLDDFSELASELL